MSDEHDELTSDPGALPAEPVQTPLAQTVAAGPDASEVAVLFDGPGLRDAEGLAWTAGYYQFVAPAVADRLSSQPGFRTLGHLRRVPGVAGGLPRVQATGQNP